MILSALGNMQEISTSMEESSNGGGSKQAACLNCRRSKTKCHRTSGDTKCKKCQQADTECIVPHYHVGRQKGTKNKRTGLEKAVHRIEQEIEKSRATGVRLEAEQAALNLQQLLRNTTNLASSNPPTDFDQVMQVQESPSRSQGASFSRNLDHVTPHSVGTDYSGHRATDDSFALDDAENPLQLLASASDLPATPHQQQQAPNPIASASVSFTPQFMRNESKDEAIEEFFRPFSPKLDVGEEIDPIDMGYVTLLEANALFNYFYQNLSHTRWGLDPMVHSATFVRTRSAFLFTSILAASAQFLPSTAALHKRLSVHCKTLAYYVMVNRCRSPEIVLAYMVNIPWMSPGKHWADDETCSYMAMALTVALDLSLNKLILRSPSNLNTVPENTLKSDCITDGKALSLDGFDDVEPTSIWGQRLLRRRERIWLALFVLDRGVCLARGRSFTVPVTALVETCDQWHISEIADTWDASIVSSAVLRRDLLHLIADIKASCDGDRVRVVDGPSVVNSVKIMIETFFDRWYSTWNFSVDGSRQSNLPPYVEILVCHTRLSTYSSVINHPSAPVEVKRFFHAAGLSSALNVMRAAVQGEGRLKSMPNNTAIMISFAACFALCISAVAAGNGLSLTPSIRILIEETADVLERIGSSPDHRKGISALYGRHLRKVVRDSRASTDMQGQELPPGSLQGLARNYVGINAQLQPNDQQSNTATFSSFEPLLFSAMSDHQIIEAIDNAGAELETCLPNFQIDDNAGLDWLDWFSLEVNA